MSTTEPARIIPLLPLLRTSDIHRLMDALRTHLPSLQAGVDPLFCIWLQLPTRVFPSSWGSISGNYSPISAPKLDPAIDNAVLTSSEMEELKRWSAAGLIRFMPVGYAGSLLSVLSPEEIRSELDWSLSNPWRTGIKDNFGQTSLVISPLWPDTQRASVIKDSGTRFDYCALGVYSTPDHQEWLIFANSASEPQLFALPWVFAGTEVSGFGLQHRLENCLAQTENQGDVVVRLDLGHDLSGLSAAIGALEYCGRRGHRGAVLIDPKPLAETGAAQQRDAILKGKLAPILSIDPFMTPDFRGQIARLPEGRRARSATQERLRTQLISANPSETPAPLEMRTDPPNKQRNLLAAMQGSVAILSNDFEARFHEGRFTGFFPVDPSGNKDDGIRFISAPGLGLRMENQIVFSETESAVSIESDYAHGLRETMVLKAPQIKIPARMYVDFLLMDRSPHLVLDVQIRYPWLQAEAVVEELRPLQLSIALGAGAGAVDVLYRRHDGSWNTTTLNLPRPLHAAEEKTRSKKWALPVAVQNLADYWGITLKLPFSPHEDTSSNESWHDDSTHPLFGSSWVFSWQEGGRTRGIELSRLPSETGHSIPLEARIRRNKKKRCTVLDIFPEGRFFGLKSEELGTLSQHFTLAVYPFFNAQSERPVMDSTIDRDIAPPYLLRTESAPGEKPLASRSTARSFYRQS